MGTSAGIFIANSVTNVGGILQAFGSGAFIAINSGTVFGGTLETSGSHAAITGDGFTLIDAAITAGSFVEVASGGTGQLVDTTVISSTLLASRTLTQLLLEDATMSGGLLKAVNGGTTVISGGTITAGALVETLASGIALVHGTVQNSGGTLLASGTAGFVLIESDAVVSGGLVEVGNGLISVLSGGTANIFFAPTGSGELRIADAAGSSTVFTGAVSGFGGVNHSNHKQFIDLVNVNFASGAITVSYTSSGVSNTSGTLFVSSGGVEVAEINFVGSYTSANFHVGSGLVGVKITDPQVVNGGVVLDGVAHGSPGNGLDLPDIGIGAHTTLAYSENNTAPGLGLTEGLGCGTDN